MKSFPNFFVASVAVCLVLIAFGPAQAGDDWRPIPPEDLASKTPTVEADADAEALFWEVRIDDSSETDLSMQHYVRVKIFTDRGREKYSKFDIPFTKGIKIKDLAARVVKPDGSMVEILDKDIFERDIIKAGGIKIKVKTFAIPNLEPGVIVEYRYREVLSNAGASGMHLKFQRDIPIRKLSYFYKPNNKKKPDYQTFNFQDTRFVEGEKGFWVATRNNVPALKEEPRMPPIDTVIPWMLLQSVRINIAESSFTTLTITIKDPGNPVAYWGSVGIDKAPLVKLMNKPDKEVTKVAQAITTGAATDEAKLQKLYEYCQTQIKNTSYDPSLTDDQRKKSPENKSAADVLKNKTASSRFVDMLFGAMAHSLGYETRVAFSADRSEMFFKPEMTNESFLHLAAIAVKVGENWRFYNPGVSFLPPGMLIWYEEGVWALLVGEESSTWVKTPLSDFNKSLSRRTGKFKLLEDGTLEGEVRVELNGQTAMIYRLNSYDDSPSMQEEGIKTDLTRRLSTSEVSDIKIENLTDPNKPLVQSYKIRVPGYAQKTGKRLFFQPSFFEHGEPSIFSSAERKYDVYFHFPWSEEDYIEFDLPAGFELDNADKPEPFTASGISEYKMDLGITQDRRTLVAKRKFFFGGNGKTTFDPAVYPALKKLFDTLKTNDDHTITLKQTNSN
jgi:hypothetical protein